MKKILIWTSLVLISLNISLVTLAENAPIPPPSRAINSIETDLANWMGYVPDNTRLSELSIPGTHDTMAYQGEWGPGIGALNPVKRFTQTQNLSLRGQLDAGVRYLDLRVDSDMSMHHGIVDLKSYFDRDVLPEMAHFLIQHPSEMLIARVKGENNPVTEHFINNMTKSIQGYESLFAPPEVTTLGEVRGKILILDNTGSIRFFTDRGYAYTRYPNTNKLVIQDNYDNPSRAEKWRDIQTNLDQSMASTGDQLYLNHISATGGPPVGSTPKDFTNDLNPKTIQYIQSLPEPKQMGVLIFDFVSTKQTQPIIKANADLFPLWGDVRWIFEPQTGELRFISNGTLGTSLEAPWNRSDALKVSAQEIRQITFTEPVQAPPDSQYLFSLDPTGHTQSSLTTIKGFPYVNTQGVKNMDGFFRYNSNLTTVDLSKMDTTTVISMTEAFKQTGFTQLSLESWQTPALQDARGLFQDMTALTTLIIPGFNTKKALVTDMFSNDNALENITLGPNFRDLQGVSGLPEAPNTGSYQGEWLLKGEGPIGNTQYLLTQYDGTKPGTYLWLEKLASSVWGIY